MVANIHYRWDFVGLSTDTKPLPANSPKVVDGSTYYESDTSKLYVFYKDTWYERKPLGGGGGGGSYTAGDGIDITEDVISVDTETIQPKLTAGTNITIDEDNVISAEGGGGPTVVQTTGTSTTDVMSQNATASMIFADPSTGQKVAIGSDVTNSSSYGTAVGYQSYIGTNSERSVVLGYRSSVNLGCKGSVAIGTGAMANQTGEVNIGSQTAAYGYNNSNYRLLTGLYDPQNDHDAATKGYVDAHAGGPTIVQTTGTSTTDVMSQNAVTSMIFADPANKSRVQIGGSATANGGNSVSISGTVTSSAQYGVAVGPSSNVSSARGVAIGYNALAPISGSIALGAHSGGVSNITATGMMHIGTSNTSYGYNNSNYRLLTGLYDGQSAHDAVTVEQVNATIDAINAALSTSIPHIGA